MELAGKTAVVTGGAHGIGRAIAERLARDGATVAVVDHNEAAGRRVVAGLNEESFAAWFYTADVTRDDELATVIVEMERDHGGLDIVINNAGGYDEPVFPDSPIAQWSRNLDLNLRAAMLTLHYALPLLEARGRGAVVNIASSAGLGLAPHPGPEYAAAKAGLIRLTACLAPLAERGIRVNCICPHTVATEKVRTRIRELRARGEPLPEPLEPPLIDPEEVADAAAQLIADDGLAGRILVLWGGQAPRLLPVEPLR